MYNAYNGKGDVEYMVTGDIVKAIEVRYTLNENMVNAQGVAWIEVREVDSWKKIKIR